MKGFVKGWVPVYGYLNSDRRVPENERMGPLVHSFERAYVAPCGLAITKSQNKYYRWPWQVKHVVSGRYINGADFSRLKDAIEYVRRLSELTDWTQDIADITGGFQLREISIARLMVDIAAEVKEQAA